MTMKTKAKKYRIRRPDRSEAAKAEPIAAPEAGSAADQAQKTVTPSGPAPDQASEGTAQPAPKSGLNAAAAAMAGGAAMAPSAPPQRATASQSLSTDIDAIRREGLTGRQLRLARRVAQKHDLPATSDYDAVRLLREKGIDPFQRANMLELVVPQAQSASATSSKPAATQSAAGLPATAAPTMPTPAPSKQAGPGSDLEALSPAERRDREIQSIQRDIARRRRRKLSLLLTRLSAFVFLPTLVAAYYFYAMATPMYTSNSSLLVIKADGQGLGGGGGLFSGSPFATSQEAVTAQDFLQSREAMQELDTRIGFRQHFSNPDIDPLQRLEAAASNDEAFKIYKRNVKVGYDPTEGIVRLAVTAADPLVATDFSRALIAAAQERVNGLSQKKRNDQVSYAEETLDLATLQRREAQEQLVRLQQQNAVLDPQGVIAALRGQISTFEIQLQEKELALAALLDNTRPNQAKVDGTRADIARLQATIARLNERMVDANAGESSLASMTVRIQMAQADLATRDLMLQSALQQLEATRMEADRQVRYLTTAVEPVPADQPSHPRRFENTVLAFLIFSGIYLLCSLTASILREQVSS